MMCVAMGIAECSICKIRIPSIPQELISSNILTLSETQRNSNAGTLSCRWSARNEEISRLWHFIRKTRRHIRHAQCISLSSTPCISVRASDMTLLHCLEVGPRATTSFRETHPTILTLLSTVLEGDAVTLLTLHFGTDFTKEKTSHYDQRHQSLTFYVMSLQH